MNEIALELGPLPPGRLARHGARVAAHARLVALLGGALVIACYLIAGVGVGGQSLFSRLELANPEVAGEAVDGQNMLAEADPRGATIQGDWTGLDPDAQQTEAALSQIRQQVLAVQGVDKVLDPSTLGAAAVSTAGDGVLVTVMLDPNLNSEDVSDISARVSGMLSDAPKLLNGSTVFITSESAIQKALEKQVESDLKRGEGFSLPLSLVIMVLIFGGFAAAGVPLIGAVASIAGGLMCLLMFTLVIDLDITVVNVVTVLGLGLCIDYSLLMVSRYREQMHQIWDLSADGAHRIPDSVRQQAMSVTMATAGRTVLFSGLTVAIAVTGLMFIDMTIIRSVGAGAVSVVAVAVIVATTLVPALLVLATRHVAGAGMLAKLPLFRRWPGAFDHSPSEDGAFSRWATKVQRRPWIAFLGAAAVLVMLAAPAIRMTLISSGIKMLPVSSPYRSVLEQIDRNYPLLATPDVTVIAQSEDRPILDELTNQIRDLPGVERLDETTIAHDISILGIATDDSSAASVVRSIRDFRPETPRTWVTGPAAILVDVTDQLRSDGPIALLFVVVATFLLLFLLTGSVLIPIKALLMNLLSLGATFGLLVLIFQDGRLERTLGFSSTGGIEATIPMIIFAFAFGLSMDYEVFLLARIKEFYDKGYSNNEAVRMGLQRTGRIITSAALLIVVVFSGFVLGELLPVKETGVALAFAVAVDATLVRIVLVPATMTLLGDWNWWAPRRLRQLHSRIGMRH